MAFSKLQKYIILECYARKGRCKKNNFIRFYDGEKRAPQKALRTKLVARSIERLIERGFLTGIGVRTREKWFIDEAALTRSGKAAARDLRGRQQRLPFVS